MGEKERERVHNPGGGAEVEGKADLLVRREPTRKGQNPGPHDHDLRPRQTLNKLTHAGTAALVFLYIGL